MAKQQQVITVRFEADVSQLVSAVDEAIAALDRFKKWSDEVSGWDFDYRMAEVAKKTDGPPPPGFVHGASGLVRDYQPGQVA